MPDPASRPDRSLYTARAENIGGTAGQVRIHDGPAALEVLPTGGPRPRAEGLNPEQLLAAAWSTCLAATLEVVLRENGHAVRSRVEVEVSLHRDPAGGLRFRPRALARIEELPREIAVEMLDAAHRRCPVSKLLTAGVDGGAGPEVALADPA
ncbi:OsmC family protein [Brachybacterium hainanense]|uniref:OsmC family protein n=1 Tax=Brachybacterium hainanense TaxID=1541174 RepID=A0ABV6RG73_9MICO